mmetsp:Transcript_29165/g.52800  ORF Transcript_29165/g.52800 Transcript_29165/m.52800 type:complete len:217 (-) Transcript_29165:20-670(-)
MAEGETRRGLASTMRSNSAYDIDSGSLGFKSSKVYRTTSATCASVRTSPFSKALAPSIAVMSALESAPSPSQSYARKRKGILIEGGAFELRKFIPTKNSSKPITPSRSPSNATKARSIIWEFKKSHCSANAVLDMTPLTAMVLKRCHKVVTSLESMPGGGSIRGAGGVGELAPELLRDPSRDFERNPRGLGSLFPISFLDDWLAVVQQPSFFVEFF